AACVCAAGIALSTSWLGHGAGSGDTRLPVAGAPTIDFAELQPSWAVGDVVHYGDATLGVAAAVHSYVLTAHGVVYADAEGTVRFDDGSGSTVVGRVDAGRGYLRADRQGRHAAWIDTSLPTPGLVVLDTATGEVVHGEGVREPAKDTEFGTPYVYAVDGHTVLWMDARGAQALDVRSGDTTVLDETADHFTIIAARDGVVVHDGLGILPGRGEGNGPDGHYVSKLSELPSGDYARVRTPTRMVTTASYGFLNPGGHLVAFEHDDAYAVFSTDDGAQVAGALNGPAWAVGYDWLDPRTTVVMALPDFSEDAEESSIDILTCSVPESVCTPVASGVARMDTDGAGGLALPVGEALG
ncbi:hypothetical protein, partial [Nocardioides massiliensis]